jgi:hypothetical protein
MTGLTREAFGMLHDILKPPGHPDLPKRPGRKWSLSSEGQLGLFLFYIGSTMNYKFLCVIFGITPNPCSRMLRNMLKLVRTCIVGRNQIKTVFDPEYERYVNLEGYDRIGQYYLRPEDFNSDSDDNNI